jgi:hypothetical protein
MPNQKQRRKKDGENKSKKLRAMRSKEDASITEKRDARSGGRSSPRWSDRIVPCLDGKHMEKVGLGMAISSDRLREVLHYGAAFGECRRSRFTYNQVGFLVLTECNKA